MNLSYYLDYKDDGSVVTRTDSIVIYINRTFEKYKLISVTDHVDTIGIFEITINGETSGFFVPASLQMHPSSTQYVTVNGVDYVRCEFNMGDVFIRDKTVVKNGHLAYVIFTEFIEKGNIPDYITYDKLAFIFDTIKQITGCSLPAEHAAFEMIYAYLSRDPNNYRIPWRHTQMKGKPKFLKLKDVPHAAASTTSKLIGAYLKESLASSVVNAAEDQSDIEDLLRK